MTNPPDSLIPPSSVTEILVVSSSGAVKKMSRRDVVADVCGLLGKWDRQAKGPELWRQAEEITDALVGEARPYWYPQEEARDAA